MRTSRAPIFSSPDDVQDEQAQAALPGLQAQGPQVFAPLPSAADDGPAMPQLKMGGGSGVFSDPAMAAPDRPDVVRTPSPLEAQIGETSQRLKALQTKDATPFGSPTNHPGVGGKILHALGVAGNIAGDIFAPSTMALIPGTQLNREERESGLSQRLQSLTQANDADQASQAGTEKSKTETAALPQQQSDDHAHSAALTREANDQADALENPAPAFEVHDTVDGPLFVNKGTGVAQRINVDGHPVGPKLQTKTVQLEIGGKPHQVLVNDASGELIKDLGESGEKPASVNVNGGGSWQLQEDKDGKPIEFNAKTGETRAAPDGLHKSGTFAKNNAAGLKSYQPALDSAERFNIMSQNYEDAVQNHDQQAMLSLLSNHLGMTAGLQKGGRITKDMYTEAQNSRPWMQGAKASYDSNGYLSGVTLAPEQMRQMVRLGRDRFQQDLVKAKNEAGYQGVQGDGPVRMPGTATMRFYLNMAKGDPATAKRLAAEDGWSAQ